MNLKIRWLLSGIALLVAMSFATLDLKLAQFFSFDATAKMGRFITELLAPETTPKFLVKLFNATLETLAMSALGTLLALVLGLALALITVKHKATYFLLNALRSIPELVWAVLLLISAGLGPMAGTLALALHTTGVLGRLLANALENAPTDAAQALRVRGVPESQVFWYATLPTLLPQITSYTLYRWENNIRAAAVLGVVGAGGLGQMLSYHLSLFQMSQTSSVLIAMLVLVAAVDAMSYWIRKRMA